MPYSLALRLILLGSTYLIPGNIWLHLQRNDRLPMNSELRANQIPLHVQRWLPGCWEETTISYCACDNIRKPGEVPCCLFVHNFIMYYTKRIVLELEKAFQMCMTFFSSVEHKRKHLVECSHCSFPNTIKYALYVIFLVFWGPMDIYSKQVKDYLGTLASHCILSLYEKEQHEHTFKYLIFSPYRGLKWWLWINADRIL